MISQLSQDTGYHKIEPKPEQLLVHKEILKTIRQWRLTVLKSQFIRIVSIVVIVKFVYYTRIFGPVIGFSFAIVVFGTSIFGNYIVTLFLPMISVLNMHKVWRDMMDRAISFWMVIPLFFLHFIYGVKVRVSGDSIDCNEPAIIIMNHRTRLDWLYFWLGLWRINPWLMTTNKIALKELLRHVPGAGFGMQASQYVFLRRDLEIDLQRLSRAVDYYAEMGKPYQILMFPEGTDKTDYTTRRSNEYAKKNGLKPFKHVLYPRTAGFIHLVKKMIENNYLTHIYDVTVAYPKTLCKMRLT
uniref:Phospholipid/glycerol acyltransferase domain-containing protein n=1 Tax=Ditylenchus dipsaci TaxID=166011 RepID=A0A915E8M4_9BILA